MNPTFCEDEAVSDTSTALHTAERCSQVQIVSGEPIPDLLVTGHQSYDLVLANDLVFLSCHIQDLLLRFQLITQAFSIRFPQFPKSRKTPVVR